ncbi:3'(2'),5'-bisphosphate nucleotidase 1-like [Mytilus galloprovincialis]|uniref:3'(2'),5'-bisphosphate nucleotidase 1-like n=1 Tax=Mytilus galloprovincialis TaxID=29158 RepID=UPI003F7C999E
MAAKAALLMRVVSASVAVSNRACQIIRDVLKKGELGIVEKGKNDFQTEADRTAQRCIIASLHKQFPKVSIFGEEALDPSEKIPEDLFELGFSDEVLAHDCPEYLKDVKDEEIVIWVDPVDGTAEYTQGLLDHVTCLIGISARGHSVAGIINQPFYNYKAGPDAELGRCIWGIIGLGSFGFTRDVLPKDEFIVTTSRSHSDRLVTETVEACEPTSVVRVGGAGHKVLLLIEGKVHAYVFASKGCKKWDTCAPESVLAAVGGRLTDMHGIKMSYGAGVQRKNTGGILATVSDHDYIVNKVPEHVKEVFDKSVEAQDWPEFEIARIQHMNNKDVDQGVKRKKTDTPDSDSSRSTKSDLLADETLDTKL